MTSIRLRSGSEISRRRDTSGVDRPSLLASAMSARSGPGVTLYRYANDLRRRTDYLRSTIGASYLQFHRLPPDARRPVVQFHCVQFIALTAQLTVCII